MSRSLRDPAPSRRAVPLAAVVLLAGHRPARDRLQVRRRLRPAAAGQQGRRRRRLRGHRRLRRRAQRGAAHRRVRQRRGGRTGHRGRAGRLARQGQVPGAQGHRAAGEHRGRRTPDQPAGGEVRRPGRARPRHGERQAALRRRLHPAVPHQPQPGGRGGPRRPVDAAGRRRRRSAQDDQPRAERDDERPSGPGPPPAGQPRPDGRRARRAEGRHHRRDGVDRPALLDAGQGEGRHRRGHRQHGTGAEGAQPTAPGAHDDAAPAGQARRGGHARAQRQHGQHRRLAAPPAAHPDQARRRRRLAGGRPVDAGQLPVPQGGRQHRPGDYANALFHMDIDLNKIIKSPGEELPNFINLVQRHCRWRAGARRSRRLLKATVCAVAPQDVVDAPVSARQQGRPTDAAHRCPTCGGRRPARDLRHLGRRRRPRRPPRLGGGGCR